MQCFMLLFKGFEIKIREMKLYVGSHYYPNLIWHIEKNGVKYFPPMEYSKNCQKTWSGDYYVCGVHISKEKVIDSTLMVSPLITNSQHVSVEEFEAMLKSMGDKRCEGICTIL